MTKRERVELSAVSLGMILLIYGSIVGDMIFTASGVPFIASAAVSTFFGNRSGNDNG